jgi:IS1 family transposase
VIIDKMLLERLALAAIARITGVSERWLQIYVNNKYEQIQQKKETGQTSYIERFNNTMGQRIGRLVRKTLSFSKKLSNHIG